MQAQKEAVGAATEEMVEPGGVRVEVEKKVGRVVRVVWKVVAGAVEYSVARVVGVKAERASKAVAVTMAASAVALLAMVVKVAEEGERAVL